MDIDKTVAELKAAAAERRKDGGRYKRNQSRLDRHRAELTKLYLAGASCAELVLWLRTKKRLSVHRSTVHLRLQKWGVTRG